ncbi:TrkA C-terminal domain-containing protein [Tichowtungia aerotolerans]|uniref:TrkA C-terminal domain-containing protein n=1 Tax=Tichowtungia aerotolerans TaxID=2697043 RepID=UPI001E3A8A8A|nr:TrkA C-terminal domain-containing protein [Tichowtungia aerotolerans]
MVEMIVQSGSDISGQTVQAAGLRQLPGGYLVEIIREKQVIAPVEPAMILQDLDRLVFAGDVESIVELRNSKNLRISEDTRFSLTVPLSDRRIVEAVVSPTCPEIGFKIRDCNFRKRYNAAILALARNGRRVEGRIGNIRLQAGDTLLVESHAGFIPRQKDSRDFLLICELQDAILVNHHRAPLAALILLGMILSVAFQITSMLNAAAGASASFVTPIGYQTNLMIFGPGRYRFSDYLNIGIPLTLLVGITAIKLAPHIWPF